MDGDHKNNNNKGHKALNKTHDTSLQSGLYKLGHWCIWNRVQISPWPVPELTGAQWVEPLPQAGYNSTLPLLQSPGITNQSQWTFTGQGPQEGTGEDKVKDNQGEMLPEQMMSEPREGYRVHASAVDNKDTSLAIAPQNRSAPIPGWPNS